MSAPRPAFRPEPAWDPEALGLAAALAALAHHAAHRLGPGGAPELDALARILAFVLLPAWAATRIIVSGRRLGGFERGAVFVVLGAAAVGLEHLLTNELGLGDDWVGIALVLVSLIVLAPRRAAPRAPQALLREEQGRALEVEARS